MKLIKEIIQQIIKNIILESKKTSFRSELGIQGYILGNFKYLLPNKWDINREYYTTVKYKKNRTPYLHEDSKGRSGRIDFVLSRENKPNIGIEIQYPIGRGLINKDNFFSHIGNDILKLQNEKGLTSRYLLIFLYNDPNFNYHEKIKTMNTDGIYISCIRLNKKGERKTGMSVKECFTLPEGWLKIDKYM